MENVIIDNKNFDDDMKKALAKIKGNNDNKEEMFCSSSPIYRVSNETISHKPYIDAMKDKEKVLAVTGSCDQILNSVLVGGKVITGIDISCFPKFFAAHKIASMKALPSRDDFLNYFIGDEHNPPLSKKIYSDIRDLFSEEVKEFWDSVFKERPEADIYNSGLFRGFHLSKERMIYNNPYLQGDNYSITRDKLDNVSFEFSDMDVFKVDNDSDLGTFDLALLSNTVNYYMMHKTLIESMEGYKKYVRNLPLNKNGKAVIYNFCFNSSLLNYFRDNDFEVYKVDEGVRAVQIENEIIVYNKKKIKKPFM